MKKSPTPAGIIVVTPFTHFRVNFAQHHVLSNGMRREKSGPVIGQNDVSLECGALLTADRSAFARLFTIQCEALGQF